MRAAETERPAPGCRIGPALVTTLAPGSLAFVVWAGIAVWQRPCREGLGPGLLGHDACPSLLWDLSPLLVALGFWAIAVVVPMASRPYQPVTLFIVGSAALAAGKLADLGSDIGARLFYILLAWLAPVTVRYATLLDRPAQRGERFALRGLSLWAAFLSMPAIIWPFATAEQQQWFGTWRISVRFSFAFALIIVALWLTQRYRQRALLAARRRIRLVAFGTVLAFAPLVVLSLLPNTINAPTYLPYEYGFPWLLMSPLAYWYAHHRHRLVRMETTLSRLLVYYLIAIVVVGVYLVAETLADRLHLELGGRSLVVATLLNVGFVLVFVPLQKTFGRLVRWVLYGREIGDTVVVEELASSLARTLDGETLRRVLVRDLACTMGFSKVALFLKD